MLLQEGKPVIYASKTEKKYADIEKEAWENGYLFACKRFEQFIYGKDVDVYNDHKPLEIIWKRPIVESPKRLQRILFNLQPYNISIHHRPGKQMFLSDALSRISVNQSYIESEEVSSTMDEIENVNQIDSLDISDSLLEEIKLAINEDQVLQEIKGINMY